MDAQASTAAQNGSAPHEDTEMSAAEENDENAPQGIFSLRVRSLWICIHEETCLKSITWSGHESHAWG